MLRITNKKIQKQKQLKNRTIKACKEFLNIDDLEILECEIEKAETKIVQKQISQIKIQRHEKEKYNPYVKPLFKTNIERYEYLMQHGCTCVDDRNWLTDYKSSKEFKNYEQDFC